MRVLPSAPSPLPPPQAFRLRFRDHRVETPTSATFRFDTTGTGFEYRSNQAIRLTLFGVRDPWGPTRSFSLSSSPTENGFIAVTAKMTGSPYKEGLRGLRPGDEVVVVGPIGDLLYDRARPAVFLAGGIGITPFRGMLRYARDTGSSSPVRLLYSARVPEEFAFRRELEELVGPPSPFRVHYTVTRPNESKEPWSGRVGRIDAAWVRECSHGLNRPKYYVAGTPSMVEELLGVLRDGIGASETDLEYEFFRGF